MAIPVGARIQWEIARFVEPAAFLNHLPIAHKYSDVSSLVKGNEIPREHVTSVHTDSYVKILALA